MDSPVVQPTTSPPAVSKLSNEVGVPIAQDNATGFLDRHFERLLQLLVTLLLVVPAWIIVMWWGSSNPHMILGTNIISGVAGFWLGTSVSSAIKDKLLRGGQ